MLDCKMKFGVVKYYSRCAGMEAGNVSTTAARKAEAAAKILADIRERKG